MKEKQQENNLMDFKLREMARNEAVAGFIKPHSGVNLGMLNKELTTALGPTIKLVNSNAKRNARGSGRHSIESMHRIESRNSNRSFRSNRISSRLLHPKGKTIE